MWLISFLPDFVVHILLIAGAAGVIAGFLLGFIPFISQYKLPIQIISIVVLVCSVYLEGGLAEKEKHQLMIAEMEKKIAKAEADSALTNIEIVEKIRVETQVIHEKGEQIIKYVNKEIVKYDHMCDLPEVIVTVHNAAALNKPIEESK